LDQFGLLREGARIRYAGHAALTHWDHAAEVEKDRFEGMIVQLIRANHLWAFGLARRVDAGNTSYGTDDFERLLQQHDRDFERRLTALVRHLESALRGLADAMGVSPGWTVLKWS